MQVRLRIGRLILGLTVADRWCKTAYLLNISRPPSLVSASTQNFQTSHFESPAVPF